MGNQRSNHRLLPPYKPRLQGVFHKFQRLLLNIRKARFLQIADRVRRDTENSSNFIDMEFPRFEKTGPVPVK